MQTAALITALVSLAGVVALAAYLAHKVSSVGEELSEAHASGMALLKSNFALQHEVYEWKASHEDAMRALVGKDEALTRAIEARIILEKRHADLVLRMTESLPLDSLAEELQKDLDRVRELSRPATLPEMPSGKPSAPKKGLPLPAPSEVTPLEKPLPKVKP